MLAKDVSIDDLTSHLPLVVMVFEVFTKQAQQKFIRSCDETQIVFDLMNNISPMQMRRLLVEPLQKAIPEYQFSMSTQDKTLTAVRLEVMSEKPAKKAKAKNTKTQNTPDSQAEFSAATAASTS